MALLTDKDLFIGICTKKERVVLSNALKPTRLPSGYLKARQEEVYWKTSDWIIQEIGLAKGRNLDLLLVEEGVRQPGGLQGNLEYIPFNRSAPEKSFGKILEMVTALSPKASAPANLESEPRSAPIQDKTATQPPAGAEWSTPKPDWKRQDYEIALMHMVATDNAVGANAISDAYLGTEFGSQPEKIRSWETYVEYIRLVFGKGGQLANLTKTVR